MTKPIQLPPIPDAEAYLYINGDHRGVSLHYRSDMELSEGTSRIPLIPRDQVINYVQAAIEADRKRRSEPWMPVESCPGGNGVRYLFVRDCGQGTLSAVEMGYMLDADTEVYMDSTHEPFTKYGYRVTHWTHLPGLPNTPQPAEPVKVRPETDSEHIARDIREGRFPEKSDRKMVPAEPVKRPLPPLHTLSIVELRELAMRDCSQYSDDDLAIAWELFDRLVEGGRITDAAEPVKGQTGKTVLQSNQSLNTPVKVPSFVEITNLAIEYGIMAGPILQGSRHAHLNESERFDAFIHTLLARYGAQPAAAWDAETEALRDAQPVAWVAADTLHSPHPTCISSLAYMSQLDRERGREYVPIYAAMQLHNEEKSE